MLDIVLSLIIGIILGRLIKLPNKILVEKSYTAVVFLLILSMGLSIGSNHSIFENLPKFGWYATLFSMFTITGSIAGIMILEKTKMVRTK